MTATLEFIDETCQAVRKLDGKVSNRELKNRLYLLGMYVYRSYYEAGSPVDIGEPSLVVSEGD